MVKPSLKEIIHSFRTPSDGVILPFNALTLLAIPPEITLSRRSSITIDLPRVTPIAKGIHGLPLPAPIFL